MKNQKIQSCSSVSEYMKIRRYVMDLLWRADSDMVLIPSLNDLMNKFDVSRPTACKAVRELVEEGYLIAKRGHGTFTNPAKSIKHSGQFGKINLPIIGIIIGDGLHVHIEIFYSHLLAELLKSLAGIPAFVHLLNLGGIATESAYSEIINENLDGLCWIQPPKRFQSIIERLKSHGLKIVTGDTCNGQPDVDVAMDSNHNDTVVGQLLQKESRRKIVYLRQVSARKSELQKILTDNLPDSKVIVIDANSSVFEKLEKLLRNKESIDAIINPFLPYPELKELLTKLHIDMTHDCRIVQSSLNLYGEPEPQGIIYTPPFESFAAEIARRFKTDNQQRECTYVTYDIRKNIF